MQLWCAPARYRAALAMTALAGASAADARSRARRSLACGAAGALVAGNERAVGAGRGSARRRAVCRVGRGIGVSRGAGAIGRRLAAIIPLARSEERRVGKEW